MKCSIPHAELLPCPFCGSDAQDWIERRSDFMRSTYFVRCDNPDCGACGVAGGTESDAIALWNRRAAVEAERAKYRALVKAADAMHGLIRPDSRLDKIHLDCAIEEYEAARKELP